MKKHIAEVTVRYAETDRMGVAHHSSFFLWFEMARTGLLREAGHTYRDMESDGALLPVIDCSCRFHKGVDYDDHLHIETSVSEFRSRSITFHYVVMRGDERVAEGSTHHLCTTLDFQVRRLPGHVAEAIAPYVEP
jgi:acyl-CoA thioester hydrolase